ncbi:MAG: XRE family transcriptional regulator [Burkholderiaceae bacterium]|jgi:predicted XRE-type DNA-binding protein|nr:XRE family transcriptional regulator [Burkholderiaceae bacterium]NCU80344.1 XRE family transcriptional regulator [Burkholderiaceae bacterium]
MKKRIINGIEFSQGSKNIFADLGLPDADKLKIKTDLVIQIIKALERLHLTQAEAAKRMGISQPKVSAMINGDFSNLSERKLMDCLTYLGYNIEIRVKPVRKPMGSLRVALV